MRIGVDLGGTKTELIALGDDSPVYQAVAAMMETIL